ncbi:hypothetical protein [Shewanella saliphila]|uniref:Uncharacterized protein n=1 Tax=Shewanella saliphila TaxID=2282698 RepID=A0ABQ2Q5N6_9GAMM|nr:hypothetical protein [Shewanella saliphila]MCL1101862.1 hypothetical protein [Shewanella saliphila]GGP52314.1 hypothetical protein GCM10009409_18400 [Shewanella saliphila]
MDKIEALDFANKHFNSVFNSSNTHFANVNKAKPVWWIEIPINKIKSPNLPYIHLLLKSDRALNWLKVDRQYFVDNLAGFKVRENKDVICLEINSNTFQNMVGPNRASFKQFLI